MLKEKPDRKLYHVTAPLLQTSLVQVVAYACIVRTVKKIKSYENQI
jgi:hypothetical protein